MNIFYTHANASYSAKEHCKVHVRKMIVEYAQILSTAHRVLDGDEYADANNLYKKTHVNHPSSKWVRENLGNYCWLFDLFRNLCIIYRQNTGKIHASETRCLQALTKMPENIDRRLLPIKPPKVVPDHCIRESVEESYMAYLNEKYRDWLSRDRPIKVEWYDGYVPCWLDEQIKESVK